MKIYVNNNNEIIDVNYTSNPSLIEYVLNDDSNPFFTWPDAKIKCYKCTVSDGIVTMMTPYIDTRMIPKIEQIADDTLVTAALIDEIASLCESIINE